MRTVSFAKGSAIIREGEAGDCMYVVCEGQVEFVTQNAAGETLVLDTASMGEFFGELSMLTGEPRTLRVRAKEDVVLLALDRTPFLEFLGDNSDAAIEMLKVLGHRLHRTDSLLRTTVSRNVNEVHTAQLTLGERIADGFAAIMGSWSFIIFQSVALSVWIVLNITAWVQRWDPYPFILLNLVLSFQSAYAAPIIMMSQNRSADKDRLASEIDHQVNTQAELKIGVVLRRLEELEHELSRQHREHLAVLASRNTGRTEESA
jgi:uncharacterized membrane protein